MQYEMLRRSREFKRVRGGARWSSPVLILEGKRRADPDVGSGEMSPSLPRFGLTITKKVGTAVVRNRIRRRIKEALSLLEPGLARDDHDYVVVAHRPAHDYPFAELQDTLRSALMRVDRPGATPAPGQTRRRRSGKQTSKGESPTAKPDPRQSPSTECSSASKASRSDPRSAPDTGQP
jgi:ribonuclease P protein component